MITHYIIMSSSYTKGKRIALDYVIKEKANYSELKNIVKTITKRCGEDVSISTHIIQTDSESWESVYAKDYFFKDVDMIDSLEEFINLIQRDRTLSGLDVAKYILSKVKCTHLKLEKLVFFCFAEYLCNYEKELFEDKIFAYKYGPIVKSVYDKYKRYGYKEIEQEDREISSSKIKEMPSRSRILFAKNGIEKINSIDLTIKKYGDFSATDLVHITHRDNTPWTLSGKGKEKDEIISNDIIKQYHHNEEI